MLVPPLRRGLFFPPGATPRINRAHPLAGLLSAAYLFGRKPIALLPGFGDLSIKTGTPAAALGLPGAYQSFTATSGYSTPSSPSGDFSVVIVAMRAVTAGGGPPAQVQLILSNDNSSGTGKNGFHLGLGNAYTGTKDRPQFSTYVADAGGGAASGWVSGTKQSLSGDIGSTDLVNGTWYTLGAVYSGAPVGNSGLNFGCDNDLTFALTGGGGIALALFFRGQLPDRLMLDLTINPGQMLLWPDDSLFAALRGPGGVVWDEALSDSVTAADDVAVVRVATVAQADSAAPADALAGSSIAAVALADAATAGDALAATSAAVVALADAGAAGDAVAAAAVVSVALADAGAAGDAVAGALAAAVSLADAATPDDAMTVAAALSAALEDSAAGVDSLLASLTTNVALQDALRAEDAVAWIVPNPLPPASRIYVVGPDGRSYALGRGSRVYVVARGARVVIVPGEE